MKPIIGIGNSKQKQVVALIYDSLRLIFPGASDRLLWIQADISFRYHDELAQNVLLAEAA